MKLFKKHAGKRNVGKRNSAGSGKGQADRREVIGLSAKHSRALATLENLEGRRMFSSVTYHGGPLLTHVEASAVFFGPDWSNNATYESEATQLKSFLGNTVSSPYMDQLGEYSVSGKTIGRGSYAGADMSPSGWTTRQKTINKTTYTTIDDSDITSMLSNEIASGRLPSPDGNRLYVVYVAPNVVVTHGTQNSVSDFTGYHDDATDHKGRSYAYAVIVDPSGYPGEKPKGSANGLTNLQYVTCTSSHELAEAVTDPDLNSWYNSGGDEIGDIAQDAATDADPCTVTLDGYTVQKLWSNALNTNYAPPSNAVLLNTIKLGTTNDAFALTSDGSLEEYVGGTWTVKDTGVTSFVSTNLRGLNQVFDLHANGQVFNTVDGNKFVYQGSGYNSIDVGTLNGTNYLFGLGSNGVLSISHGTGWSTLDTGVSSFRFTNLHGLNQLFDLHTDGRVFNTVNGQNLVLQGTGYTSIAFGDLNGTNYLFGLKSNGTLLISHGTGWSTLDTGVSSFVVCDLNGVNQLFDLHTNGLVLNTIDGQTMIFGGSGYTSIAAGNLNGINYLFGLGSNGVLTISHGTGWSTLDTSVSSFVFSDLNGLNQLFDLHANGTVYNTIDGQHMVFQGSGDTSISVGNLGGTNYLFGLGSDGVLSISHGSGWSTLDTGVSSFAFSDLNGLNQLFDLHANGIVDNTIDGLNMVFQGSGDTSLAVGNLGGTNYLFGLGSNGVLSISHGTGWFTLDTNVNSFTLSDPNGVEKLTDVHTNGSSWYSIDGSHMINFNPFQQASGLFGTDAIKGLNFDGDVIG